MVMLIHLIVGLEHQVMTRSPPPAPPPTATGGKRGSIASHSYTVTATPPGPSPAPSNSRLSPAERREIIYGPGGVFGPTGVFRWALVQNILSHMHNSIFLQHAGDLALSRGHAAADQADQLRGHGGRQVRPVGLCGGQVGGST